MKNFEINNEFLNKRATMSLRTEVLKSIADHYGTTVDTIEEEVFNDGAEHLLDYMPANRIRDNAHMEMKRLGFSK